MVDSCAQNPLWRCKDKIFPEVGHTHSSHVCVPCSEAFLPSSAGVYADFRMTKMGLQLEILVEITYVTRQEDVSVGY